MSTNSVIAKELIDSDTRKSKWVGRYVHWNGSPEDSLPHINQIVANKGLLRAIDILVNFRAAWSYLDSNATGGSYLDGRAHGVTGYGVAYNTKIDRSGYQQASWDEWHTQGETPGGYWVYVLTEQGIQVWSDSTFLKVQAWGDLDCTDINKIVESL